MSTEQVITGVPGLCQKIGEVCLAVLDLPEQGPPAFCSLPPHTSPYNSTCPQRSTKTGVREKSRIHRTQW